MIISAYKKWGETPLETIRRFKATSIIPNNDKVTYAGRLDPAAEGLLILLSGEDRFKKEDFLKLPKTYNVSFVLGISTDTYDLLGLITNYVDKYVDIHMEKYVDKIKNIPISSFNRLKYPPFSSRTFDGKPLWLISRDKSYEAINKSTVNQQDISKISTVLSTYISTQGQVFSYKFFDQGHISSQSLLEKVNVLCNNVTGDFRQEAIKDSWNVWNKSQSHEVIPEYTVQIECSSGTYMRSIVNSIGLIVGIGAVTTRIIRTKIGSYSLDDVIPCEL